LNKKTYKEKDTMVSISEMARLAGVSRAAASAYIKRQEAQGIGLVCYSDRRGKMVDTSNPLIKSYIHDSLNSVNCKNNNSTNQKQPVILRKMKNHAEKLRLENQIMRGKYIETEAVLNTIDKYIEYEKKLYKDFPKRLILKLEKDLNIKIKPEVLSEIETLFNEALMRVHDSTLSILDDFKAGIKTKNGTE